jgi:hypothetical protein
VLGNKLLTIDKLIQLIVIVSLVLVGLSDSEDILGKKCALTVFRVRQRSGLCQMRGNIDGNRGESEVGSMAGKVQSGDYIP